MENSPVRNYEMSYCFQFLVSGYLNCKVLFDFEQPVTGNRQHRYNMLNITSVLFFKIDLIIFLAGHFVYSPFNQIAAAVDVDMKILIQF